MNIANIPTAVHHLIRDLIEINNDRVAGFKQALEDLDNHNEDLVKLFGEFIDQSKQNSQELLLASENHGLEIENETSVTASLHRAWIDVKSLFSAQNREAILAEAERGEDIIKAAYRDAIASDYLNGTILTLVAKQAEDIKIAHDKVKQLRELAK